MIWRGEAWKGWPRARHVYPCDAIGHGDRDGGHDHEGRNCHGQNIPNRTATRKVAPITSSSVLSTCSGHLVALYWLR